MHRNLSPVDYPSMPARAKDEEISDLSLNVPLTVCLHVIIGVLRIAIITELDEGIGFGVG